MHCILIALLVPYDDVAKDIHIDRHCHNCTKHSKRRLQYKHSTNTGFSEPHYLRTSQFEAIYLQVGKVYLRVIAHFYLFRLNIMGCGYCREGDHNIKTCPYQDYRSRSTSRPRLGSNCGNPGHDIWTCPFVEYGHRSRSQPPIDRNGCYPDHDIRPERSQAYRSRSRSRSRPKINKLLEQRVWEKGRIIPDMDPNEWRLDCCGNKIKRNLRNFKSIHGWQVDHIIPWSKGG